MLVSSHHLISNSNYRQGCSTTSVLLVAMLTFEGMLLSHAKYWCAHLTHPDVCKDAYVDKRRILFYYSLIGGPNRIHGTHWELRASGLGTNWHCGFHLGMSLHRGISPAGTLFICDPTEPGNMAWNTHFETREYSEKIYLMCFLIEDTIGIAVS